MDRTNAYVLIHGEWTLLCEEASAVFSISSVCLISFGFLGELPSLGVRSSLIRVRSSHE